MPTISHQIKQLINRYQEWYRSLERKEEIQTLHVDEVASAVARFYEKIRGVVDWREEHLLRKSAIERILRRRLLFGEDTHQIAEPFILELIRAGHFPNDSIPESKIGEVQMAIDKYIFLVERGDAENEKQRLNLQDWLLGVAACELEEILSPPSRERAMIGFMTSRMEERITVQGTITERTRTTQISIACQRALFKVDTPLINYHLLKKWYPNWNRLTPQDPELSAIAGTLRGIQEEMEQEFHHPMAKRFYTLCEKHDTPYLLLGDIIDQDAFGAEELLSNPEALEATIKTAYSKRLARNRVRIKRAAVYSTLSIFLTKIVLALGIEIPVDRYLAGGLDPFALGLNIAIPPLLMTALVLTIRPPSPSNLRRVIMEVVKLSYETRQRETFVLRTPKERGALLSSVIFSFYVFSFVVSFGVIIWTLTKLHFTPLSQVIFLMFISLVSFAGVKLRQRSKELVVEEEKGFFLFGFLDLFALPIVQVGKWLSGKLARYNVFLILLSAIVEMPLQIFIEFLEQWRYFLREKKEEIH